MSKKNVLINLEGATTFKVLQGASYTVPDTISSPSVTGYSSGISPTTLLDAVRSTVGGQLLCSFSDIAGNAVVDVQCKLDPGDVVAVAAVASSAVVVTVTSREGEVKLTASVPATAVAGVIGVVA